MSRSEGEAEVVWLLPGGDAVGLETAVLDGLDELDERLAVEETPWGCVSIERARVRRAPRWGGR